MRLGGPAQEGRGEAPGEANEEEGENVIQQRRFDWCIWDRKRCVRGGGDRLHGVLVSGAVLRYR